MKKLCICVLPAILILFVFSACSAVGTQTQTVAPTDEADSATGQLTDGSSADQTAAPGDEITLHAEASDPDGDAVAFTWSEFSDADTYEGDAQISGTDSEITFKIPDDAKSGDTIHVLLTGTDDGEHNLSRYQRVIIKVQ